MSWVAPYRYSALHDFKIKMERRFPHLRLPSFPPKSYTLFGTHGPEFLDDRRHGLETFVQGLLSDSRFHCKELKNFLDPTGQAEKGEQARQQFVSQNQARSLVSPAPSPSMESYDDVAEDSFLLPNFPPNTKVPEVIALQNGEECFVAPLVNEMKVNIDYLWRLKRKMKGKDIDIKLHMLEDERGKINTACMVLEGERRLLETQLLADPNVRALAVLHTWLEFSNDKIKLALEWANHVEESLLLELSPKTQADTAGARATPKTSSDTVTEDLLIDLSGPAPAPSAVPYPLQAPPQLQMPPGAMYPPPSYYYPPSYAMQPPGSTGGGVPQPFYAMPPQQQHHLIPSMPGAPGYPMITPGYPQPPLSGNMMGAAGSGVLMPPTSGNYPPMSGFGAFYQPIAVQGPAPVPFDAQQQQQQQSSTSSSALAYPGISAAPSPSPYGATSSPYSSSGAASSASTTQQPPSPVLRTSSTTTTSTAALSPSLNVSSSFSPLPLRVGALSVGTARLSLSSAPQEEPKVIMEQQQSPLRLSSPSQLAEEQQQRDEEEQGSTAPPAALSSSYGSYDDPFTASVTFNSAYPADSFAAAPIPSSSVGSPLSTASFLSSSPAHSSSSTSTTTTSSMASLPVVESQSTAYATAGKYAVAASSSSSSSPFTEARSPSPPPPYAYASSPSSFAPVEPQHNAQLQQQQPSHYYVDSNALPPVMPSPSPSAGLYAAASAPPAFSDSSARATIGQPVHSGTKREKDLGERIQSYEKKAEKLVVLAVERPDQLTETEKKMKGLINKIKADQEALVAQFARRNDAEAVSQRLNNILTYIQENYDLMKRFRTLYAEDQLNVFEERMYGLLSEVNSVKGHDMDEATKFHQKMTALMREMALYHSVLRKKLEEEQKAAKDHGAVPDDLGAMNKNHLLNRLEDLQENMADFEHNFCTQYKVKRDLGDRAKQMFKQMKVKEAQQKHNVAQDSLYEL